MLQVAPVFIFPKAASPVNHRDASIRDLTGEVAGVEVRHEAAHLAILDLEDAYPIVGDSIPVGGPLRRPPSAAPSSVANTLRKVEFISPKVLR